MRTYYLLSQRSRTYSDRSAYLRRALVQHTYPNMRAAWLGTALTSLSLHPVFFLANNNAPPRPSAQEISSVFTDLATDSRQFNGEDFQRLDETPDSVFYSIPRFVEHIDAKAVKALIAYHDKEFRVIARALYDRPSPLLDVLDVCSSWVSHLHSEFDSKPSFRVTGVGLNKEELSRNPQLNEYLVQDLNSKSVLPFPDKSFDVVLLQLSIDYLTQPVNVLREVGRVLRPGGEVLIAFSNRVFIDKAVALWTGKADIDHIETVGSYMFLARDFTRIEAVDISPSDTTSDPLFVVKAFKK